MGPGAALDAAIRLISRGRMSTSSSPRRPCIRTPAIAPFFMSTCGAGEVVDHLREVGVVADEQHALVGAGRVCELERVVDVEAARQRSSTTKSEPSCSQASRAVSRARIRGLVTTSWKETSMAVSARPAARDCSSPRSVRRRSTSGRAPCGSASPWRRNQSCWAIDADCSDDRRFRASLASPG